MADNLVIVESPAKARTIKKYLGRQFEVLASYGHVRDLVPKEGAVDPDKGYAMKYQVLEKNERHVAAISRALDKSRALYLATDPDREGEAIAWHLKEILDSRGNLDGKDVHRVVFYEITRNAIREAVERPRRLSMELVNAQQARRALDYLVGFFLVSGLDIAEAGHLHVPPHVHLAVLHGAHGVGAGVTLRPCHVTHIGVTHVCHVVRHC